MKLLRQETDVAGSGDSLGVRFPPRSEPPTEGHIFNTSPPVKCPPIRLPDKSRVEVRIPIHQILMYQIWVRPPVLGLLSGYCCNGGYIQQGSGVCRFSAPHLLYPYPARNSPLLHPMRVLFRPVGCRIETSKWVEVARCVAVWVGLDNLSAAK